jgi:hypothetical protein
VSSRKPDEHDGSAGSDVKDEVVRSGEDCEGHRERRKDCDCPNCKVGSRHEQDDSNREVPPDVETREGGVLIRESGRLERAVGLRLIRHGVDQAKLEQPRRGNRHEREEEEPNSARDEERIAQQVVAIRAPDIKDDRSREDHRPVAPDVDPVGEHDQAVAADDRCLDRVFPGDTERALQIHHALAVRKRLARSPGREVADGEVREDRARDERRLAQKTVVNARTQPARDGLSVRALRPSP